MDFRSPLFTFLSVYRHGSQLKAAKALHLSQPAVSQQLKLLEFRFGKPLFKRIGKHLEPTPFAHQLALQISKPCDSLDAVWNSLKLQSEPIKTVTIGGLNELMSTIAAPNLHQLIDQDLNIKFIYGHEALEEKIIRGELDIAQFCAHVAKPGIEVEKFFTEEFVLIGHPKWLKEIPKKSPQKIREYLNTLPWIAFHESLLFIKDYYLCVFDKSFEGKVIAMLPSLWSILNATIAGVGITIMPSYFCFEALKENKVHLLYEPPKPPLVDFYLGWKDGALVNPYIKRTKAFLQQTAKEWENKLNIISI